MKTKRC